MKKRETYRVILLILGVITALFLVIGSQWKLSAAEKLSKSDTKTEHKQDNDYQKRGDAKAYVQADDLISTGAVNFLTPVIDLLPAPHIAVPLIEGVSQVGLYDPIIAFLQILFREYIASQAP